jgi:hypothetical protein
VSVLALRDLTYRRQPARMPRKRATLGLVHTTPPRQILAVVLCLLDQVVEEIHGVDKSIAG